jgi:hypothetical protein
MSIQIAEVINQNALSSQVTRISILLFDDKLTKNDT